MTTLKLPLKKPERVSVTVHIDPDIFDFLERMKRESQCSRTVLINAIIRAYKDSIEGEPK